MRVQLRRQLAGSRTLWRITEADGELTSRWLPTEGPGASVDGGGFEAYPDALGFSLAIDWVRAYAGLLGDLTIVDIDRERAALDVDRGGRLPAPLPDQPWFEAA